MASSRWKRFAFFERHTLNLPSEVLEDLIPLGSDAQSTRRSLHSLSLAGEESFNDSVSLVVTTAALPLTSRPKEKDPSKTSSSESNQNNNNNNNNHNTDALEAMWSSLTACAATQLDPDKDEQQGQSQGQTKSQSKVPNVQLSSQAQLPRTGTSRRPTNSNTVQEMPTAQGSVTKNAQPATDGLVLSFVTSSDTELVHCFDVTARCNPPTTEMTKELEDLDGWRGYFAAFVKPAAGPSRSSNNNNNNNNNNTNNRSSSNNNNNDGVVAAEHMESAADAERVIGLATCRLVSTNRSGGAGAGNSNNSNSHQPVHVACLARTQLAVWEDPHLYLSCRRPLTSPPVPTEDVKVYYLSTPWNAANDGFCSVVDIVPGIVAVGTDTGAVLVFAYDESKHNSTNAGGLKRYLRIPPPPAGGLEVVSVRVSVGGAGGDANVNVNAHAKASIFVAYRRSTNATVQMSTAGICCYDMPLPGNSSTSISGPSARHDLDGRYVGSPSLVDAVQSSNGMQMTVARPDGLYSYSRTERIGVAPIDGTKLAICLIPPPAPAEKAREIEVEELGSGYALIASTDEKSGRDAVDIYDSMNKLVAFHLLLSPGHRAVRAAGVTTSPTTASNGSVRGGRSSSVVLTSGGSLVTLTEKSTAEKISLLVQKNLYSAAIVVAYADPSYEAADITMLYRTYAEHLYRKGDFSGAIEQYMHTIGSLESSHVIFRYLDAPKIPLLVKYLEKLRSRELATPVHSELLRTCYLKLNDTEAAEAIAASASSSIDKASLASIISNLANNPKEALATICSLDGPQAAEVLTIHGASLARVLPRETAGIVISLCVGTYSPKALAAAALLDATAVNKMIEYATDDKPRSCEPYPVNLFASAFIEHPKMLRLILAHCNRNKCPLTPSLRRTLLDLTLAEWNQAKRSGDTEAEKLRHKEAIAALTDTHCRDIGDYDALVIVQQAGFEEGELLLYERLQMAPMLMSRYAKEGSEKSRRQMLAMCQSDPEILADVLGHFVSIASQKLKEQNDGDGADDESEDDEAEEILDDIQEALALARRQGVLPPVRIARILAGEGTGQFSSESAMGDAQKRRTVPLSVALDYVGTILEDSRKEISRLKSEVEEYNLLCNTMESEIGSLLRASNALPAVSGETLGQPSSRFNIDELYRKVRVEDGDMVDSTSDQPREAFWRDMNQSEDSFETIARFFAKGVLK